MTESAGHIFSPFRNRRIRPALNALLVFVMISVLAPFIANDRPLLCKYHGAWLFPAFSPRHALTIDHEGKTETIHYDMGYRWKTLAYEVALFPVCAYSPNSIDNANAPRKSPFDRQYFTSQETGMPLKFRHWLGTTQNGNDVLSCLVHGASVSVGIGIFSMLIAGTIGILLGAAAGYYRNSGIKTGFAQLGCLLAGLMLGWFYGFEARSIALTRAFEGGHIAVITDMAISVAIFCAITMASWKLGGLLSSRLFREQGFDLPLDSVVSKLIELINSVPALLCIIAVSVIAKPSYYTLVLIIGGLSWTHIARLARAEYMKASALDYVVAGKAMGLKDARILFRHILPNALPVIMVQVVFGMAGATMAEAALSFIGVGIPPGVMTWGALLNEANDHFSSWWLVLFPGLCIFSLILAYHAVANNLTKSDSVSER